MAIIYPTGFDVFSVPSLPEDTSLSSAGTSTRDHTQNHQDLGLAIMALQVNAAPIAHNHSNAATESPFWPTPQLEQVNTHQLPDTDGSVVALHHTLGYGATQAAAGNHAHDYEGPSIYDKPLVICTSTTRPQDPNVGEMVWETDTNIVRAWAQFPNNVLVSGGVDFTYTFDTNNDPDHLDEDLFEHHHFIGDDTDGFMGAPDDRDWRWNRGNNVFSRWFARAIVPDHDIFLTDDHVIEFTTGEDVLESHWQDFDSPSCDFYLRCSDDFQSYVRFRLFDDGVDCHYTLGGFEEEVLLGQVSAYSFRPNAVWLCKCVGNTYVLYADDVQIISVVDYEQVIRVDSDHRGWGLGMCAGQGHQEQTISCNVVQVHAYDLPNYASELIWQLLPVGAVPHMRAEAHFAQKIIHGPKGGVCGFDTVLHDWDYDKFTDFSVSQTDITVTEAGHYQVHTAVPWDPGFHGFDQAGIGISVNGLDIGRKTVSFMRGNGFAPGYPQTNDLQFTYYFARGDIVRIWAQHNAPTDCWLFWHNIPPNIFTATVNLDFIGP